MNRKLLKKPYKIPSELQVLLDLDNSDKHGSPLRVNHSRRNPIIRNVRQGLVNNNHGKPIVMTISQVGETKVVDGDIPSVVINADIYDGDGDFLFDFDTLVETSLFTMDRYSKPIRLYIIVRYEYNRSCNRA